MNLFDILAMRSKLKSAVILVLYNSESLTIDEIFKKIKGLKQKDSQRDLQKESNLNIKDVVKTKEKSFKEEIIDNIDATYSGVHKAIKQLLADGVIKQSKRKYFLSHEWIDKLEKDIIKMRRSYETGHLIERKESSKIALVTGSALGLGREILLDLAKDHKVVVHYNTSKREAMNTLKEALKLNKAILVQADLKNEEQVKMMFQEIREKLGDVDVLINTVGDFIYKPINETKTNEFKNTIEGNLSTAWHCTKEALPHMRNKGGKIINFGCAGCDRLTIRKNTAPYYMAKTSLYMLTKALANEEAKNNVRINMISPGILETSEFRDKLPAARPAQFNDIIKAIRFLLSNDAEYINGANLEVSGAWIAGFE